MTCLEKSGQQLMSNTPEQALGKPGVFGLRIGPKITEHLEKLALAYFPVEICGILTGRRHGNVYTAYNFHWIPNISEGDEKHHYIMDPQSYFDVIAPVAKNEFVELVAMFHTHPRSAPVPSETDISCAIKSGENLPYLIYNQNYGFKAWILKNDFKEIAILDQ